MASSGVLPLPLRGDGEVDHHDGVLLHDAHQHDQADEGVEVEIDLEEHQRQQSAPKPADGRPDRIVIGWMKLS